MRCVEFETRLNELLDGRASPAVDAALSAHARRCPSCAEMLAGYEALLDGVASLPPVAMTAAASGALAPHVVAAIKTQSSEARSFGGGSVEIMPLAAIAVDSVAAEATVAEAAGSEAAGSEAATCEPFRAQRALDVAAHRPASVAKNRAAAWGMAGVILAAAAAILIAVFPQFQRDAAPETPDTAAPVLVEKQPQPSVGTPSTSIAWTDDELEPIAWVGYHVADGLKPVTSSMVSYLRELRKRPLFRSDDVNGRSSFLPPRDAQELTA
jgi:hypothetical protein